MGLFNGRIKFRIYLICNVLLVRIFINIFLYKTDDEQSKLIVLKDRGGKVKFKDTDLYTQFTSESSQAYM